MSQLEVEQLFPLQVKELGIRWASSLPGYRKSKAWPRQRGMGMGLYPSRRDSSLRSE